MPFLSQFIFAVLPIYAETKLILLGTGTPYHEPLAKACNGCDILVHEVYSELGLTKRTPQWQK